VLFVLIKVLTGKPWEVKPLMYLVSLAFAAYFMVNRF
jgi:xanthine/uracil/vitamin C permease (AzgA family)